MYHYLCTQAKDKIFERKKKKKKSTSKHKSIDETTSDGLLTGIISRLFSKAK